VQEERVGGCGLKSWLKKWEEEGLEKVKEELLLIM
jgi:hypothetical protein